MLVTPSNSTRTVRPATAVANHMKVRRRENAGRRRRIAFHQMPHSDSGGPRSGMVVSMGSVGSGHPIGTMDSQFVNQDWAHDPDTRRRAACGNRRGRAFRRLDGTVDIPEHGAAASARNGPRRPGPVRGPHGQATPGTAAGQYLRGQPFPRWTLRVDGLARGPEIYRGPRRPVEPAGARAARRQATQIDLARRRMARSGAIHSARPEKIPG